ncbi:MAG: hypothetical protein L0H31_16780, partial [Nocardioidaceae bacterium]|nr:hypothetical protein [Nocardioidaceae bacterium]
DIPGLTASGAVLSGTPTAAGNYTVRVTDEGGAVIGEVAVTVREQPAFTSSTTETATYGQFVGYTFTASGFPEPEVTIDRSTLPAGFYVTHSDTFEGVPEETGTFTISATASNGTTDVSRQLTLTINKAQFSAAPAPVITGVAKVGETLGLDVGEVAPHPDEWSYQWLANGTPIADATGPTYVPRTADVGKAISVEVTASRAYYVDATATSGAVGPVATDQAPDVALSTARTELRRGASTTLRWSTTHAETITARGAWNGPRVATGRQMVKPTLIGNNVYRLEATNDNGTSVAQVVIGVRLPAAHLAVAAPRYAVAGRPLPVAVRGLDPRESYRIVVGGTVVATGKANAAGKVARRVQVPARAGRKAVRVIGAEADRTGSDTVQVRRKLAAHVAHARIRASDRQQVEVRNLLPRQRVVVLAAGHQVGVARANRRGVATVGFKVGQIWGTVEVVARAGGQTATTSYRIFERCPGARYVCP